MEKPFLGYSKAYGNTLRTFPAKVLDTMLSMIAFATRKYTQCVL